MPIIEVQAAANKERSSVDRSSHQRCSMKKSVLRKFTGKHPCQSLFFDKVAGLRLATLLKKRFLHWYFPVNFGKSLRTPFLQNISGRLLLHRSIIHVEGSSQAKNIETKTNYGVLIDIEKGGRYGVFYTLWKRGDKRTDLESYVPAMSKASLQE